MILIGQLAVLELHGLAFGQERDLNRVFAGSFFSRHAGSLCFFFCHFQPQSLVIKLKFVHSNSAFAIGCGAVGPSPKSVSSMFLPFSAEETALSIINSANRVVPWFKASMALRIA